MTGHQGRGRVRGILEVKSDPPMRASHNCLWLLACTWGFLLVANRETYTFSTTDDTLHVVLRCKINHYFPNWCLYTQIVYKSKINIYTSMPNQAHMIDSPFCQCHTALYY